MCSQPIVQATQLARVRACVDAQLLGREARRLLERAALKVARRQRAEAVERQQVGRRAQLAVLRRRRAERPLRQVAAERGQLARVRPLAALRAAHGDRLDVLAAEHRAAAAAAGVAAVVRDRGVAHGALAGRADRGDPEVGAEPRSQRLPPRRWHVAPRTSPAGSSRTAPSSMTSTDSSRRAARR